MSDPDLTPEGARRVYRILLYLVHDRGEEVDPSERQSLEGFRRRFGLGSEEAEQMELERNDTSRLLLPTQAEKPFLIDAMIDLVAADGCLEHEEQVRLHRVASVLGLPRAELADKLMQRLMGG